MWTTPALERLFQNQEDDADLWRELQRKAEFASFWEALERHLERYGDRSFQELKLETPGLRENPSYVLTLVRM